MQAVQMLCKAQALAQHKSNFQLVQEEEHEYDIIGHPQLDFKFVVVFPFHPYTDGRKGGEVGGTNPHPSLDAAALASFSSLLRGK